MTESLQNKLEALDISIPYIWRLKLSKTDFKEIEVCLKTITEREGVSSLAKPGNAILTIVYMAEWYKREYQGGNKCELTEGIELETLWDNAGINKKKYLYEDENGNKRWLYSIYVLGGLAIKHELGRNDNMKFLKGLCRIYHGEDYTLENLDEASRAIAFRESIKRQHSLYEYMRQILNGDMPFHEDDLADAGSDVNRFVARVKSANDEILKVKFRFEWQVTFSPHYTSMTRRLNVWLKPEDVGGELHQYLRYDRVHLWGVKNPENQHKILIYIRFKKGGEVIEPSTMEKPIITYLNTGQADTGYVAFGVEKCAQIRHIPSSEFDTIEIVAKTEDGKQYIAQTELARDYIQMWRNTNYGNSWTSTQNSQKETALLFSNRCMLRDESITDDVQRKNFNDERYGQSEVWNWFYIYDSITFTDERGKEITLYNRIGYDQITTRLYTKTIHYINGGKIKHYFLDDQDESNDYDTIELPLIFSREDLIVRHFKTKDDILNALPEEEEDIAELIEFKKNNGFYTEWTVNDEPSFGEVQLRITVKGRTYPYKVIYLPRLDEINPIKRDFDTTSIRYRKTDKTEETIYDSIPEDKIALSPTLPIHFGEGESYSEVDVYRPTEIKEVLLDGAIIEYRHGDEKIELPYILKDRVQINDFSANGYQSYECKSLRNIYTQTYIDIEHNPNIGTAAMNAWRLNRKYAGKLLDSFAPECLTVCFGKAQGETEWEYHEALYWNYDRKNNPEVVDPNNGFAYDVGVIFQNTTKNRDLICNLGEDLDNDPWAWDNIEESPLRCFEIANEANNYFFLMKTLRDIPKKDIVLRIYQPLLEARNGYLSKKDKAGLIRLGQELGFDWQENNIYLNL